jgi:hypothetical protein
MRERRGQAPLLNSGISKFIRRAYHPNSLMGGIATGLIVPQAIDAAVSPITNRIGSWFSNQQPPQQPSQGNFNLLPNFQKTGMFLKRGKCDPFLVKSAYNFTNAAAKVLPNAGKRVLGKIPGVGTAISGVEAVNRFRSGDYLGAGISGLQAVANLVPGVGTAVSLGLDAFDAFRPTHNPNATQPVRQATLVNTHQQNNPNRFSLYTKRRGI